MGGLKPKRYQIQFGMHEGEKGYVVVDAEKGPVFGINRVVLFTSDSKGDTRTCADLLNEGKVYKGA
jgi:hypothetical protein